MAKFSRNLLNKTEHIAPEPANGGLNEESFALLYKRYAAQLLRAAAVYSGDGELAKEIVQEVFLDLWKKKDVQHHQESWLFFLLRCAKNKSIDQLRKLQRQEEYSKAVQGSLPQSNPDTEQQVFHNDLLKKVNKLVEELPGQCRQVYVLNREKGLNNEQIATKMGIATKTVKNHLHKALSYLRANLTEYK